MRKGTMHLEQLRHVSGVELHVDVYRLQTVHDQDCPFMIARTRGDDDAVAAAAARAFNEVVDAALRGARVAGRKIPKISTTQLSNSLSSSIFATSAAGPASP